MYCQCHALNIIYVTQSQIRFFSPSKVNIGYSHFNTPSNNGTYHMKVLNYLLTTAYQSVPNKS